MPLFNNRRLSLGLSAAALAGLIAAFCVPAQAQGQDGPGFRMQSAPANPQPRKQTKRARPVEAQVRPTTTISAPTRGATVQPAPGVDEPAQPSVTARRSTGLPPPGERRLVVNEVVIEVAGRPTEQEVQALASRHRLNREESQVFTLSGTTMFRWTIPDGRNVATVIRELEADNQILSVQPNYRFMLQQQQSKAGQGIQYAVEKLRLPSAHEFARGKQVLVAVIDSGIDVDHPELQGTIEDVFDPADGDGAPHAHGTSIAGAIVAHAKLTGVAPSARILAVRAFDPDSGTPEGTTFNILKGLEWATQKGARVINMSFAGPQDPIMARVLSAAAKRGIVLVAAAGNAGPKSPPLFPASDPNVIAVTATDAQDKLFQGSNRGHHVAVAAPGVRLLLPTPGGNYDMTTGTSFAAAHISGIAALLLEREPGLSPDSVRRVLLSTARDLGPKGRDKDFGAGLADAYEALRALGVRSDAVAGGAAQGDGR
jgi:hypothetical protein